MAKFYILAFLEEDSFSEKLLFVINSLCCKVLTNVVISGCHVATQFRVSGVWNCLCWCPYLGSQRLSTRVCQGWFLNCRHSLFCRSSCQILSQPGWTVCPWGSSVHEISQIRNIERVATSSSRGFFLEKDPAWQADSSHSSHLRKPMEVLAK